MTEPHPAAAARADRVILLLRGINVGGHRLAMATLRSVLEEAGCTDVVTYIQSGNAVVTPPSPAPTDLAATLSEAISAAAGYGVPVVVRTRDEMAAVVDANPYPHAGGTQLHVVFMVEAPPAAILESLDLPSFLPEECAVIGRELYMHLPNGMGQAVLPTALDKASRKIDRSGVGTSRNWNTVLRMLALADR